MEANKPKKDFAESHFAITVTRPVAIFMIVIAIFVFGSVSYQRLALTLMPDISYPTLTVRTDYDGAAPAEVENLVSKRLEEELSTLPNLVTISSISKAGRSDIILEFAWNTDMNFSSQDVREKVDRIRLPTDVDKPLLLKYDPSLDPIMRVGIYGPQSLYDLRLLGELDIKKKLETIAGVAAVKVNGGLEEEIHVELDEQKITNLNLNIQNINNLLERNNINMPGGNLKDGQTEYLVRTLNEFKDIKDIEDLVISRKNNTNIYLRDIARVYKSHKDREIITRVNGTESIEIEIYKEADANIVTVAHAVKNRLYGNEAQSAFYKNFLKKQNEKAKDGNKNTEEKDGKKGGRGQQGADERYNPRTLEMLSFIQAQLPKDVKIETLSDQSIFIEKSINEVINNATIGGLLAVLVLFVFLRNIRHTIIIAITIPVSVIATFAPMYIYDVSLNIMSLGGLALGIGMLVDNSIVVLENIFRCHEDGDDLFTASVRGVSEVGGAVIASTLTTVAVFFPIVFVEGVAGQVFGDMALTVVFSLLASLAVALYLIPMLSSLHIGNQDKSLLQQIKKSNFLDLHAIEWATEALKSKEKTVFQKIGEALFALVKICWELIVRFVWGLLMLVLVILKCASVSLYQLLIAPFSYIVKSVGDSETIVTDFSEWAHKNTFEGILDHEQFWPKILSFTAIKDFNRSFAGARNAIITAEGTKKAALWLATYTIFIAWLTLRFAVAILLKLSGSIMTVFALYAMMLFVSALILAGMLLLPAIIILLFIFNLVFGFIQRTYPILLKGALKQRSAVIILSLGLFIFSVIKILPTLGSELIPQVHQSEFNLNITLPVGTPLDKTGEVIRPVEAFLEEQEVIERITTTVGSEMTDTSADEVGEHTAQITVKLVAGTPATVEDSLIERIRIDLNTIPDMKMKVSHPVLFSFKTPIELEVRGISMDMLRMLSEEIENKLLEIPELVDVKSSLRRGNPELQIIYDREKMAEYDLNLRTVADLVLNKVRGRVATDIQKEERHVEVLVRLREEDRLGVEDLKRLIINPNGDIPIPLSAIARIRVNEGPSEIRRIDQQRAALIRSNIRNTDLAGAVELIHNKLSEIQFPSGYYYQISGQNEEMERSLNSLFYALALAVFLVYVVMASQFESFIHPLIILFTVPLAIIGVLFALGAMQMPLSIVVFLGMIVLAGIVVNNAIVLVDYINRLRSEGMEKSQAIIKAAEVRMRPIFITTSTTVLALLPMAIGMGEGSEIRAPLAITVITGLLSSTLLTLVVIPVVYSLIDIKNYEEQEA